MEKGGGKEEGRKAGRKGGRTEGWREPGTGRGGREAEIKGD